MCCIEAAFKVSQISVSWLSRVRLVAAVRFDLDQFMAGDAALEFLHDRLGEAGVANRHHGIQVVSLCTQKALCSRGVIASYLVSLERFAVYPMKAH